MAPTIKIRQEWLSQLNALFTLRDASRKNSLATLLLTIILKIQENL